MSNFALHLQSHIGCGLNVVRPDGYVRAFQRWRTDDAQDIRADALDMRSHRFQHIGQFTDMRLTGRVVDNGFFAECGGQHDDNRCRRDAGLR